MCAKLVNRLSLFVNLVFLNLKSILECLKHIKILLGDRKLMNRCSEGLLELHSFWLEEHLFFQISLLLNLIVAIVIDLFHGFQLLISCLSVQELHNNLVVFVSEQLFLHTTIFSFPDMDLLLLCYYHD